MKKQSTIYNKLIRDNIPQIIEKAGKKAIIRPISGKELKDALGQKILEESFELFNEWQRDDKKNILKEAADLLEILLAAIEFQGFTLNDLMSKQKERTQKRGAFQKHLFLEQVTTAPSSGDGADDTNKNFIYSTEDLPPLSQSPSLIYNPEQQKKLLRTIQSELQISTEVRLASAFYSPGQANLLISELSDFTRNGGLLKVIFSTMGNITRPEYFPHFQTHVPEAQMRIFHPPDLPFDKQPPNFHVKTWLFTHGDGSGAMLIGSSNFTQAGMQKNVEWNYFTPLEINLLKNESSMEKKEAEKAFPGHGNQDHKDNRYSLTSHYESAVKNYDEIWHYKSVPLSDEFLKAYETRFEKARTAFQSPFSDQKNRGDDNSKIFDRISSWGSPSYEKTVDNFDGGDGYENFSIKPNEAQQQALETLAGFRKKQINRAAVIAATGIGKTFLAAFDFMQSNCKSVLFIAHREKIVADAMRTFRKVLNLKEFGAVYGGGNIPAGKADSLFAMIQTLSRSTRLSSFDPETFEYIVIDEFHHSEATTYRKVLNHFKPRFLLGLTATPERMDGRDVLEYCDYNIVCEIRVMDAIKKGWLTPFQYFAIYDETDYEQITWRGNRYDEAELEIALQNDTRTLIIAQNLKKYLPSSGKIKALAFCSSVSHAKYTAKHLNDNFQIPAVAICGDSSHEEREQMILSLKRESHPLNVICTVDIFNEGVDIPEITHILFLRPTLSFTLFFQQLGRGLRLAPNKDFLVVLDFIGNFRKVHIAPLALCGCTSLEAFSSEKRFGDFRNGKSNVASMVEKNFPESCHLSADVKIRRLWQQDLKQIINSSMSRAERLKIIYHDIKSDLNRESALNLVDMLSNAYDIDPGLYLKPSPFGSWLRTRLYCDRENCPAEEQALLNTPGEIFLRYIETGLNPTRSYKMVVIKIILDIGGYIWQIQDIAEPFREWYLTNSQYRYDYTPLQKVKNLPTCQ
ncbi:Type III restriction protein res subunit [Desulfamplus magnetovallimortis]|uniref:Type III restriction protein res subunit n=1 Tax=Desulfamplus magnetovallimortis TaxID=1246637 RepID=A0A1W1HFH2_9BACT|nr:DEAD/DEAH box helicase family protein [Desulfamplus magnetovallimortis]SLM31173.1 Type III restriction protein res subunit [Desulfamplus magnetovallimortis]